MENQAGDINLAMMLDGNAVAGVLQEIFAEEMTGCPSECATCGNTGELGTLKAFTQAPGIILRCSICGNIVLRIAVTPRAIYLDARGAKYIRLERRNK